MYYYNLSLTYITLICCETIFSKLLNKFVHINCKQLLLGGTGTPLLPPDKYLYVDGRTDFLVDDVDQARSTYNTYAGMYCNRHNKRKYVDGAMYYHLFKKCSEIIEPIPGAQIILRVRLGDSTDVSTVKICCDINLNSKFLLATNKLGKVLHKFPGNTSRSTKSDNGKMFIMGKGKLGNGKIGCYNLTTKTEDIESCLNNVASLSKLYYTGLGLHKEIASIQQARKYTTSNSNHFVPSIVQSIN